MSVVHHPESSFAVRLAAVVAALLLASMLGGCASDIPVYGYRVVARYPHDTKAFTEGLFYKDGAFYESAGGYGRSTLRRVQPETGKVLQQVSLPSNVFGEGIVDWDGRLIQLTWHQHMGYVRDLATMRILRRFRYPGEGWALTRNATHIYMSDGSPDLRILDPRTLVQVGTLHVTAAGIPVRNLNELEWVRGQIFANVWLTSRIARIDPRSGHVVGWIDLHGLFDTHTLPDPADDVLEGIAYDAAHDRLFVTGKCWPYVYQIKLTPPKR